MNKFMIIAVTTLILMSGIAFAQQISDIVGRDVSYTPGSYIPIPSNKTYFDYRPKPRIEVNAQVAPEAAANLAMPKPYEPVLSQDGSFIFPYGVILPSIICAPLHLCEVSLQPGETIQQLDVGDTLRWEVKLARSNRDGVETSHLIIKPTEIGIVSNLVAITDKRTYTMQLISRKDRSWMPKVAFSYPDDMKANWAHYFAQNQNRQSPLVANNTLLGTSLDFKYKIKGGKPTWRPTQVYSDNAKTYIHLPYSSQNNEIPVLVLLGPDSTEQLVNYRWAGDHFIVDKVVQRAALISGVGRHQERIEIVHEGY